jgi:hypothetical protein
MKELYHKDNELLNRPSVKEHYFMHEDKLNNENLANLSPPLVRKVIGLKNS